MADDKMLQDAIEAVANGNRDRARDLLTRLLKANQANPKYWLWMSSVVDTSKERIYCLQKVLQLSPDNKAAQLGLLLQGVANDSYSINPLPVSLRNWQKSYQTLTQESNPRKAARFVLYAGATLLVVALIMVGFIGPRVSKAGYFGGVPLTVTPVFETLAATATMLPTNTPRVVTPTPTFIGPTPLWMFLEATYTPTPLYVNTPHPATEAYRAGIRSFLERKYSEVIFYMQQAAQTEPDQPDIQYYLGEAYLLSDEPENALIAFEKAITLNPNFAPAYLGRAKALAAIDPKFDLESDLSQAVALDPNFAAAQLDLVAFYLSRENYQQALDLLNMIENVSPDSPLLYAYRSQVLMESGEYDEALEAAENAYGLDQTILGVYKTLGELYYLAGDHSQSIHYLEIYLRYVKDDPTTWATYGQALFNEGDQVDQAMKAFDLALTLDENSFIALLNRGFAYLALGEGQSAVNDLFLARNFDRESFNASLGLARALALSERYEDAISQFSNSEGLSETLLQQGEVYYWRAKTAIEMNDFRSATQDFTALMELDADEIPVEWIEEATHFLIELTPTATMTSTPQPPTQTPTSVVPTSTPTLTSQPTRITPSPSPTLAPSPTTRPRE